MASLFKCKAGLIVTVLGKLPYTNVFGLKKFTSSWPFAVECCFPNHSSPFAFPFQQKN
jgi:hypothetical protein